MYSIDLGKKKRYFNDMHILAVSYGICFTVGHSQTGFQLHENVE